jgi:hypothetical protein
LGQSYSCGTTASQSRGLLERLRATRSGNRLRPGRHFSQQRGASAAQEVKFFKGRFASSAAMKHIS